MDEIMTTQEVSKYLRLHEITILKLAKNKKIPNFRVGRKFRFRRDLIEKWLEEGGNFSEFQRKRKKNST